MKTENTNTGEPVKVQEDTSKKPLKPTRDDIDKARAAKEEAAKTQTTVTK